MNNTTLGICIALIAAALIVGGTLAYSSANAITIVGKPGPVGKTGGNAGIAQNGGFTHANGTDTNLQANGKSANGVNGTG